MRYFLLLILVSTNALAINNPRTAIITTNEVILHQENNKNIQEIAEKNATISTSIDKYKTCIDKNLIFLGNGASNVDADKCYDVTSTVNSASEFRPKFEGILSGGGRSFKTGVPTANLIGRFAADVACNSEFPGSRALVYEDLKYVLSTLNLPANINSGPIWVYDSVLSHYDYSTNKILSKNLEIKESFNDCNGWGTTSATDTGAILTKLTVGSDTFFNYNSHLCSFTAAIACVKN